MLSICVRWSGPGGLDPVCTPYHAVVPARATTEPADNPKDDSSMSIAITNNHRALAETASSFLTKREALAAARELLEAPDEPRPALWDELVSMGWLGLHLPKEFGGSGYGWGSAWSWSRRRMAPSPPGRSSPRSSPAPCSTPLRRTTCGRGSCRGWPTVPWRALWRSTESITVTDGVASGPAGVVLGGGMAQLLVIGVGDDLAVVEVGDGVTVEVPTNLDLTRRSARVTLDGAPATIVAGGRRTLTDLSRLILSAEAVGMAAACTDSAAAYTKERVQFGRVIGMFQAVKHHSANMAVATQLATSAVWDAAKAASTGGDQLSFTAAVAATLAAPAADLYANLSTQVHGGIAITWEHDAHLYMRRATTLLNYLDADSAAEDLVTLSDAGSAAASRSSCPPRRGRSATRCAPSRRASRTCRGRPRTATT